MLYIGIILFVIVLFIIIEFNTFTRLRNKIKQSRSSIDVYLTQRFDLIPNLVECVKGYMKYESETLTKIAEMRASYNSKSKKDRDLNEAIEINNHLNRIMAVAENNPDLKASEQFLNLQKSITKMESQLQAARRVYNGDVTLYNSTISTFPNIIFAKWFGFKEMELFKIEEEKKENIKVDI